MNVPTLHNGLEHLLEASGVKSQYPHVVFFSAYNTGEQEVLGSGIEQLVKFRLLHPAAPILFFSFLPEEILLPKDEFSALQLDGTEFIQLPTSKEEILKSASDLTANPSSVSSSAWKGFAEKACKTLLSKRIKKLKHGNKFAIGNKVLIPLRLNCSALLSSPQMKEDYMPLLKKNFEALYQYMTIPEIAEILQWSTICPDSSDIFLQNAFKFVIQLNQLLKYSAETDAKKIISLIESINESFQTLQSD